MATGDKLVTLDGLKAAYDAVNGDVVELKNATNKHLVSNEIKIALLACIQKVAWTDENGQDYYDALSLALNPPQNLESISAVYTQPGTIYSNTPLSALRSDLVVTAHYSDETSAVIHAYTLSGTLAEGDSTVTVLYGGKSATFTVDVTDAALLYKLPQAAVFDGSNAALINTNVVLFPEDRDLTIVIDMQQSGAEHHRDWIFWCGMTVSPYYGYSLRYVSNSTYGTGYAALAPGEAHAADSYRDGTRNRFVLRKRRSSKAQLMCYNSTAGLSTANATENAVAAPSSKLWLGGVDGNSSTFESYNFIGTIYDFKAYARYFEDEEAYAYLDAGVSE